MITKYCQKSLYEFSVRFMFTLKIGINMFSYVLEKLPIYRKSLGFSINNGIENVVWYLVKQFNLLYILLHIIILVIYV